MTLRSSTTEDRDRDALPGAPSQVPVTALTIVHHPRREGVGASRELGSGAVELGRESSFFGPGVLDHPQVSRRHARIASEGYSLRVDDLGSRNGTFLNGQRVAAAHAEPGAVIEVGSLLLLYHLTTPHPPRRESARLVGKSGGIARVLGEIDRIAPSATTVLVLGETGTGKELVAREIHDKSGRTGELVAANCGSLTDNLLQSELFGYERGAFSGAVGRHRGLFETADRGTLLLDEIGDASHALQVSLLRVLQEREVQRLGTTQQISVDVRTIAATHQDLPAMVAQGSFREDLYGRLSRWVIRIPPLRERREDIPLLGATILARLGEPRPLHKSAVLALVRADFPRNVRQLEAVLERLVRSSEPGDHELRMTPEAAAYLAEPGRPAGASMAPAPGSRPSRAPAELRRDAALLEQLLREHGGNVTHLARHLAVGRNTLYRWLKDAGVSPETTRH
jgi:DNA-binding NtrC family response regulator